MIIGFTDMTVTKANRKQIQRHKNPKRSRVETDSASSINDGLETSSEYESSSFSESTSEFAHSPISARDVEKFSASSYLVSSSACKN